jgi:response regulator RpfG family c-di-GMP phosphodiesterase
LEKEMLILYFTNLNFYCLKKIPVELLLIEDEPSVISLIERGLKEEGYHISIAMDGYTGLKMAGLNVMT